MSGVFTYIWLILYGINVGKSNSPMDGMGLDPPEEVEHLEDQFPFLQVSQRKHSRGAFSMDPKQLESKLVISFMVLLGLVSTAWNEV